MLTHRLQHNPIGLASVGIAEGADRICCIRAMTSMSFLKNMQE